jgi:hypothetical protein
VIQSAEVTAALIEEDGRMQGLAASSVGEEEGAAARVKLPPPRVKVRVRVHVAGTAVQVESSYNP